MTRQRFLQLYENSLATWHPMEIRDHLLLPAIEQILADAEDFAENIAAKTEEQNAARKLVRKWRTICDFVRNA